MKKTFATIALTIEDKPNTRKAGAYGNSIFFNNPDDSGDKISQERQQRPRN